MASGNLSSGDICKVGFLFKPAHTEKHYLMDLAGQLYHTTWSRKPSDALEFSAETVTEAIEEVRVRLKQEDFGRDDGYDFCGFVERSDGQTRTYFWA